jgi:hypothetical protein
MSVEVGKPFPEFALPNQDGKVVRLEDFAGKWLVVYVYPKDDTPGCTIQGKSFTASKQEFEDANIEVVGVSTRLFAPSLALRLTCWPIPTRNCSRKPVSASKSSAVNSTGTVPAL